MKKTVKIINGTGEGEKLAEKLCIHPDLLRLDLIKRSYDKSHACGRSPTGNKPGSGMRHSSQTRGKGTGSARVQRNATLGIAVSSPNNVGGRRAHPPKANEVLGKRINKKENRLAIINALASSFVISDDAKPESMIISREMLSYSKTKQVFEKLSSIGYSDEFSRIKSRINKRKPGRGTYRGRLHPNPKSFLYVTENVNDNFAKLLKNIHGTSVCDVSYLNVYTLCPGGTPGRRLLLSPEGFKLMNKIYGGTNNEN